jgi:glycerol-3-phosphate dehydrogenase (NAD(P)+)
VSRVAVLGAGSWGTTLAVHLANAGHEARLWGRNACELAQLEQQRENRKFLPGITLPDRVNVRPELEQALLDADFTLFVVPSQGTADVAARVAKLKPHGLPIVATKGLELGSLRRMSEVVGTALGDPDPVVLTGPSHAEEVSRGIPTSVVAAARDERRARAVQELCSTERLRVYTNDDVAGCEYGAALKNVIAIAAGVCDGLGFGDNTKGALLTRGLAEISRVGVEMGGRRETFFGLTGLGDLIATAMSRHSRNRHVGECVGRGESLEQALSGMVMVAEGVHTTRAAHELARARSFDLPIVEQVYAMLYEGRRPAEALRALMTRDLKRES